MKIAGGSAPLIRKGATFPFQIAAVAWVDLHGYGAMISDARFDPLHSKASAAIKRLRAFHQQVAECGKRSFPTLVMNDGAVAYRDLSLRTNSVTHEFIVNSWEMFTAIKNAELAAGYPGPRMVIAAGFRMRGRRAGMDQTAGHFGDLMARYQAKKISAAQAITEASRITRSFDVIPQLQANFAFTKAYVAESEGKAGGLAGPNCFVELSFFDTSSPDWVQLGPQIEWKSKRLRMMEARFALILSLLGRKFGATGPHGTRNGLQVAEHLAGDEDVLAALREAPRQSHRN